MYANCPIVVPTQGIAAALPLMVLFDYAAAFPSVAHCWLFAVLKGIKIWSGFMRAIKRLYQGNEAYIDTGG